jgi:hypothetical protein
MERAEGGLRLVPFAGDAFSGHIDGSKVVVAQTLSSL